MEDSPHKVGATKQHQRRGRFGKKGDTWGIQGDSPAGYCFVLRGVVPSSVFK